MSYELVVYLGRESLWVILLVAGPILGLGLITGLLVSIFQATTQIQEQTLAFIPKIVVVLLAIVIFGPWILQVLVDFVEVLFENIPYYIG